MATPDDLPGDELDMLAAELALGLLDGPERAAALRRQLAEPAFARAVEHWRAHFAGLFATVPAQPVSADLLERVERQIGRESGHPAASPAPVRPGFWRPLALATSLAAATLAGVLLFRPAPSGAPIALPTTPSAQMVAALAPADKGAPLAAYYDPAAQVVRMPAPMPIPAGHSAQLWAIVDGKPPIPLGLFRVVGTTVIAEARGTRAMAPGTTLAISFEPVGGSPTGKPTGPVVASGTLSKV